MTSQNINLSSKGIASFLEIARESGLGIKHAYKVIYFRKIVEETLHRESVHYNRIANLFCGNGLASWCWLLRNGGLAVKTKVEPKAETSETISVDIHKTTKYDNVEEKVISLFPNLKERNKFIQGDLTRPDFYRELKLSVKRGEEERRDRRKKREDYLVIAIHACGNLTDFFIKNCLEQRLKFAVSPCCHDLDSIILVPKEYPSGKDYDLNKFDVYQDLIRAQYAREQGYKILLEYLPKSITPKNRIIIGIPNQQNIQNGGNTQNE